MGDFEQWESASKDLYSRSQLHFKHGLFQGLDLSPLGVSQEQTSLPGYNLLNPEFVNVIPYHSETWDQEFYQSGRAAVLLDHDWPEALNAYKPAVFLKLSANVSSFKKAVIEAGKWQSLNLGIDPFSLGLWKSCLFKSQLDDKMMNDLVAKDCRVFRLTTQSYDMAGASDAQQLAILLSSVTQLINDYKGVLSVENLLKSISFELTLSSHLFGSIAKVSALRLLVGRLMELLEVKRDSLPAIYSAPSAKLMSHREPWNNILKLTAISAAARMGGANGVLNGRFDLFNKKPTGQRVSRNVTELLELESFLGRVDLPTEGSFTFHQLTETLCEKAWQFFKEIESKEGLLASLRSGWIYSQVKESSESQMTQVRKVQWALTGSNQYPLENSLSHEFPLAQPGDLLDFESWWQSQYDESDSQHLCDVVRWVPHSLTLEFEKFHFLSDQIKRETNKRPEVLVVAEPGVEKNPKYKASMETLKLGGFDPIKVNPEEAIGAKICLLVATDPDGDFARATLDKIAEVPCKVWAGEKDMEGFDTHVGLQSDRPGFFRTLYKSLGRSV